eukprot:11214000-Lingulodinium_polyedra.AAC.1
MCFGRAVVGRAGPVYARGVFDRCPDDRGAGFGGPRGNSRRRPPKPRGRGRVPPSLTSNAVVLRLRKNGDILCVPGAKTSWGPSRCRRAWLLRDAR